MSFVVLTYCTSYLHILFVIFIKNFVQKLFTLYMKISLHVISPVMHLLRSFYVGVSKKFLLVMLKTKRVQVVSEKNQHRHTGNEMETVPVADLNSTILDAPPAPHPIGTIF